MRLRYVYHCLYHEWNQEHIHCLIEPSYASENPSQTAVGHTWLCFFPVFPLPLLPGSHTGGIWNLLAAESHRAIKPSKAHKQTRGRALNNVGPTSCQQTQRILNLYKPHCSFFILAVSRCLSKLFPSFSLLQTPPGNSVFTPKWKWCRFQGH